MTGHGEGLRREGREADLVAPASEDAPLGTVDAAGVVDEDGLQGIGHALVGGPEHGEGRGLAGDDLSAGGGGHGRVSGGGIAGAIWAGESCAITPIIARRTGVRKRPVCSPTGAGFAALAAVFPPIRHGKG